MDGVLYVPKLMSNLFSVHAATQKGLIVQFGHSCCWIKDASGKVVGKGRLINRMYQLNCEANIQAGSTPPAEVHQSSTAKDDSSNQKSDKFMASSVGAFE